VAAFVSLKLKELERKVEQRFGKMESAPAGGAFSPGGFAKQRAAWVSPAEIRRRIDISRLSIGR